MKSQEDKTIKLIIPGRLDGLNKLINANRQNPYVGAKVKKDNDTIVSFEILHQLNGAQVQNPVFIDFLWVEKDRRRDPDNVASGKKYILDALVRSGVLKDDTQRYIRGFTDSFEVDKDNPRIEVLIREIKDD